MLKIPHHVQESVLKQGIILRMSVSLLFNKTKKKKKWVIDF